jgi:two-component system chemotaxis response regulator CheB
MAQRNMIAIGGSAGSVQVLKRVVEDLPQNLPASLFVVIHTRAREHSVLAELLDNIGALNAVSARDSQRIENGTIYVAPPDRHMLIAGDHIHLSRGPKEGLPPSEHQCYLSNGCVVLRRTDCRCSAFGPPG